MASGAYTKKTHTQIVKPKIWVHVGWKEGDPINTSDLWPPSCTCEAAMACEASKENHQRERIKTLDNSCICNCINYFKYNKKKILYPPALSQLPGTLNKCGERLCIHVYTYTHYRLCWEVQIPVHTLTGGAQRLPVRAAAHYRHPSTLYMFCTSGAISRLAMCVTSYKRHLLIISPSLNLALE